MDLTRDFIEKIDEMTSPETITVGKMEYSKNKLYPILPLRPKPLETKSLSSIVDYLTKNVDSNKPDNILIHVVDEETVKVYSRIAYYARDRENYIEATAPLPAITFNHFMDREAFNIMLQSCFKNLGDREVVLRVIGSISIDQSTGVEVEDDGVTQNVEAKAGAVLKTKVTVPNPTKLAPFRTFTEIEQPTSEFVLRINKEMKVALFTADGGAWKQEAMKNIKAFLQGKLSGENGSCPYTIIA
ncbi:MAG: hypothetical protein RSD63_10880 [Eubacterium sp.]